jgi:hypothetical protein
VARAEPAPKQHVIDTGPIGLTVPEVKQLWWFFDGSIRVVEVRHHLWRSWGFCPRHTWAYVTTEIQLRADRPFQTSMYEDLSARAARAASRAFASPQALRRRLKARASCFTCDYAARARDIDPRFVENQRAVNRLDRLHRHLETTRDVWEPKTCPACLGGDGLVCRPHILHGVDPPQGLGAELSDIAERLRVFSRTLTWRGPNVGPTERVSWVESLGWFGGWDFVRRALRRRQR